MVAGRPSPAPLGPVYPAGSALGGGWGLLWPYRSRVFRWCLDAVTGEEVPPAKAAVLHLALECDAASGGSGAVGAVGASPSALALLRYGRCRR